MSDEAFQAFVRDILGICSRKPHRLAGAEAALSIVRQIEDACVLKRDQLDAEANYRGPARDGLEAQHGLNDVFPGDKYYE